MNSPRDSSVPAETAVARQSRPPAGLTKAKSRQAKKPGGTLTYAGAKYKLNTELGIWPALQFARAAEAGWRTNDPRGLAAIHAFLEDVLDPEDWPRFQEDMIKKKVADIEGLMSAANQAVNKMLDAQTEFAKKQRPNGHKPAIAGELASEDDDG